MTKAEFLPGPQTLARNCSLGTLPPASGLLCLLGEGEHGVYEVHVGADGLLSELLGGLLLSLRLVGQLLGHLPVALRLLLEVVDHAVKEVLDQLGVQLLGRNGPIAHCLNRVPYSIGKLLGRLVDLVLLLLIHNSPPPFSGLHLQHVCLPTLRIRALNLNRAPSASETSKP